MLDCSRGRKAIGLLIGVVFPCLALAQPNPVGTQPAGSLSGKIVYLHAGHGYVANNEGSGGWGFQRPLLFELIEDLSNQDMMTFLAEYLFNAGATIVPLRPIGHQPSEVVLDNDSPGVTFFGAWSDSVSPIYYGDPGDVPYRFASTSLSQSAVARYRPNLPAAGLYPVYAWTRSGSDRAADHLYRIAHTGGVTEVTINHRRVGSGLVYLGTYHFDAGSAGYVDISNRSSEPGRVVIADMVRFGNGMGDISRGAGVSGLPREDEATLYWIQAHLGQGIPESEYRASSDDRTATVSASPRWAEWMNREADGSLSDRVFVSYHSNAGGGNSRGVLGLYNGNNDPGSATPNQFLLADLLAREIRDDMVALNGAFEHDWHNNPQVTLDRSDIEFGEINNYRIQNEFDATIVEWAYHDNALDTNLMRDPKVREVVARATYQGLVRYFNAVDGGQTPILFLPDPASGVHAIANTDGTVTIRWTPPTATAIGGSAPTGYRVYASTDGRGFDGGTFVPGGAATSHTFNDLSAASGVHYFKVAAVNAAGESMARDVVAASPGAAPHHPTVLIVNGYDRMDRFTNSRQTIPGVGTTDRVRPRSQNSRDYAVQVAEAIEAFGLAAHPIAIATAQNENVLSGEVALADYDTVVWICGEESSVDDTFDAIEQSLVSAFVSAGGNLIVSGSEIGWDLDNLNNGRLFYRSVLRASYVLDDAGTYTIQGALGSVFSGLTFNFDDGSVYYDATYPDVIAPNTGSSIALTYVGGTGGGAATHWPGTPGGSGAVFLFGFPFETILGEQNRADVMAAMLASLPGPCPCERDGADGVTVFDLLAYLDGWFAQTSAAEMDGAAGVTVFDLLAFLDCWFPASAGAACP